jgi:hypothetical protein
MGAYEFVQTLELTNPARVYLLDQLASTESVSITSPCLLLTQPIC